MRRSRVLIGMLGLDQHEVGAIAVARMLRDAGMEVVYAGCFNTPSTLVRSAVEEDIDVIGVSCHSWEYIHYAPELIGLLKTEGLAIAVVMGGSVITPADACALAEMGVAAAFGPGATQEHIIATISALSSGPEQGK